MVGPDCCRRTWRSQAGTDLASFHSNRSCYAGNGGKKSHSQSYAAVNAESCNNDQLCKMRPFVQQWHTCDGDNQLLYDSNHKRPVLQKGAPDQEPDQVVEEVACPRRKRAMDILLSGHSIRLPSILSLHAWVQFVPSSHTEASYCHSCS